MATDTLARLEASDVESVTVDDRRPSYGATASGYRGKIPTRYRLKCTDGRTRRVYVMVYGNSGSAYVVRAGLDTFLSIDVETMIEDARDAEGTGR